MASILVKIFAENRVGSVVLRDGQPGGQRWEENTPGEHFIGYDHRGNFQMGTYANAGHLFLEEPNRGDDSDRSLYPTAGVLLLRNFPYPNASAGSHGSGELQESSGLNARRQGSVTWQVVSTW